MSYYVLNEVCTAHCFNMVDVMVMLLVKMFGLVEENMLKISITMAFTSPLP